MKSENFLSEIIKGFFGLLFLIAVLLSIETLFWKPITFYVSLLIYFMTTFLMLDYSLKLKELRKEVEGHLERGRTGAYYIFALPYMQLCGFILLSRSIWLIHGAMNFQALPNSVSIWTWVLYGLDNLISVVSFDIATIYGFNLSQVEHARTFWMSSLVFSYKLSLSLGLLKIILLTYRRIVIHRVRKEQYPPIG